MRRPVGRASSSLATGTRGSETVEYGACGRVLWPTLGRVALWLVSPVGRWCLALVTGARVLVARLGSLFLFAVFVSPYLDSNPARSLGPPAKRFAHIVWVGFESPAVR